VITQNIIKEGALLWTKTKNYGKKSNNYETKSDNSNNETERMIRLFPAHRAAQNPVFPEETS